MAATILGAESEADMRIKHWPIVTVLLLVSLASAAWAGDAEFSAPRAFTLALGDSLAFGFQEAKFTANPFDLTAFHTGFAFVFATRVADTAPGERTTLLNLGCPGETTDSFLTGPCLYHAAGLPLHVNYAGAQIDAAEAILESNRGKVGPILVSLGANDVLAILDVCGLDPGCTGTVLPGILTTVAQNLHTLLGRLRAAAPDAEIILLQYYNPLAVIDPSTNVLTLSLNGVIGAAAAAHRARVADAFPAFNLAPPQPATLCALTLMCTPEIDIHASDAGYALIADLVFQAAGYTRFEK